ncbi:MAG: potassium channel family protein [Mariprofundaceae bacterium]
MDRRRLLRRTLDVLLFAATVAAVGVSFWEEAADWMQAGVLMLFVALFGWRWLIDEDHLRFLKENWLDLAFIVLLASPLLRLFMALKLVGLAPALRLGALVRVNRRHLMRLVVISADSLPAALSVVFLMAFGFGAAAYFFEHPVNPGFAGFHDGLWWAFVTLTTVGYGDIVPVTFGGRVVGVMAMVFGIAVYSLVIANVSRFVEQAAQARAADEPPARKGG